MLKPSMSELMKRVGNRYLLVNLAAQRARDISVYSEENADPLQDKAVKMALDEIAAGTIIYKSGPRVEPATAIILQHDLVGALDLDLESEVLDEDSELPSEKVEDNMLPVLKTDEEG